MVVIITIMVAIILMLNVLAYFRLINISKASTESQQKITCSLSKQKETREDILSKLENLTKRLAVIESYKDVFDDQRANILEYKEAVKKRKESEQRKMERLKAMYSEIKARRDSGEKLSAIAKEIGMKTSELDAFCKSMGAELAREQRNEKREVS